MNKATVILLIIFLTVISGIGDSQGFLHSSNVWKNGKFILSEAAKSTAGFGFGILFYWFAIKYMQQVGVISAEIQTITWFVVTIIGVAIVSGKFILWGPVDKAISVGVLIGIGLLLFRTGG
ncbi:hypothetical protein HY612_01135 [Candidatus Roizmanbacteria bacterium]|nr:hypothetical protein [Candidatus Roizmanbacteria bacterium]